MRRLTRLRITTGDPKELRLAESVRKPRTRRIQGSLGPRRYALAMAALRAKLRERVQPFLEPGEHVEQVFLAQTGPNPNLVFLTYLVLFFSKYRVIAVTDRSVVVLGAGVWRQSFPKGVIERLPRGTGLGPTSGALWSALNLPGDKKTWVHRRFYHDVEAADASRATRPPADPDARSG